MVSLSLTKQGTENEEEGGLLQADTFTSYKELLMRVSYQKK